MVKSLSQAFSCVWIGTVMVVVYLCSSTCFDNLCIYLQSIDAGHILCVFKRILTITCTLCVLICAQLQFIPSCCRSHTCTSWQLYLYNWPIEFVPDPSLANSCNTIPPLSNSDNYGIVMELNRKPEKAAKAKGQLTWRYYADWNTARQLIDTFNWDSDYIELTVLEKNDTSNSCILCVKHYPAARLPHSRRNLP